MNVAIKIVYGALVAALIVACGEKKPPVDCNSAEAKNASLQILAKKFLEDGLKGFSEAEIQKLLSINDVKTVEQNGSYYKCKANFTVAFPSDLGGKIGNAFSTIEARNSLQDKLEIKFGLVNGPGMYNQINAAITDGPYGVVPQIPTAEQLKVVEDTVKKNAQVIAGADNKVSFTYEITPEKLADGKEASAIKAYVNDLEAFDLDVVLLSLGGVL